jgi:hypothetical protein
VGCSWESEARRTFSSWKTSARIATRNRLRYADNGPGTSQIP